ncbi:MAG: hypothetical protein LBV68_08345 [Spirochaetaceae bacterium]|jgi:hypothetical protein|nr:hypothetical protein [Spirochaetaceae bacterium]
MYKFIFELDGIITTQEILPLVSNHFGVKEQIDKLVKDAAHIPSVERFIRHKRA